MRDLAQSWPRIPDWSGTAYEGRGIHVATVHGLTQHLISGNIAAFGSDVGAMAVAPADRATIRMARDRVLVTNADPARVAPGWNAGGYAATDVSAMYHVFDIAGPGVRDLLREALLIDPAKGGPSAAVVFAGLQAVLYCVESPERLRLHVERGHATYLVNWLEARD
jgi:sarcosine oxidase gamma subunit